MYNAQMTLMVFVLGTMHPLAQSNSNDIAEDVALAMAVKGWSYLQLAIWSKSVFNLRLLSNIN